MNGLVDVEPTVMNGLVDVEQPSSNGLMGMTRRTKEHCSE